MLRVRTIYAQSASAAADYYTRYLTEAPGEIPGTWQGAQAVGLGCAGDVVSNDLLAILEGRDPGSGTPLGRALVDRQLANGTVVKAVAGFDATFSAPKSLSVLWALTRDVRLLEAHDVAVGAALAHLERYGSTTRVRVAGGRRLDPDSQGLTIAAFRQTTSRADDPQIHTHCVISAKVQTDDERWLALDARYLEKHQRMLGGLYQSVLRNELTHRFGIAWGDMLREAEEHHDRAARLLDRHHPARAAAHKEVEAAQERVWSTNADLRQSKGLKRRRARHQAAEATDELTAARERQQIVEAATLPDGIIQHGDVVGSGA